MQIHELNTFSGTLGPMDFFAVDSGFDTAKISGEKLLEKVNADKVNQPRNEFDQPVNGIAGQLLRTNGDGSTEWTDVGNPTDAQTAQAVSDWLDAHPEATTTVADGSLTDDKFSAALKLQTIKEYLTPEMYGAVGDGATDDTTAIQNCINDAYTQGKTVVFRSGTTYAVSTIEVLKGDQSIDFGGCTLKGLTSATVLKVYPTVYDVTRPNGYIKNVTIDMNDVSERGLHVAFTWRRNFDTIIIINAPTNGIAFYIDGVSNSCAGNIFNNLRGRGIGANLGTKFLYIDAGDNTFSNIDFADFQIGVVINKFAVMSNVHGYIPTSNKALYPGSKFMELNNAAQLTNVYPDTQQYAFDVLSTSKGVTISNLVLVFGNDILTGNEAYPPAVFKAASTSLIKNIVINGLLVVSEIYDNTNFSTLAVGNDAFEINGFVVNGNSQTYTITEPGFEAVSKTSSAVTFKSARRSNMPVCYKNRYVDVLSFAGTFSDGGIFATWMITHRICPMVGIYPAIWYDASADEYKNTMVEVSIPSNTQQRQVKSKNAFDNGDKLFIDIPTYNHLTYYYA